MVKMQMKDLRSCKRERQNAKSERKLQEKAESIDDKESFLNVQIQ